METTKKRMASDSDEDENTAVDLASLSIGKIDRMLKPLEEENAMAIMVERPGLTRHGPTCSEIVAHYFSIWAD